MKLNKETIAKVVARILVGISPSDFTCQAKRNLPYQSSEGTCLYVLGPRDKSVPIGLLTNLDHAPMLIIALSYEAVTLRNLQVLWLIDISRGYSSFPGSVGAFNFGIIVIGDVGKDSFTRNLKYGIVRYPSVADLLKDVDKQVGTESKAHLGEMWEQHA